MWRKFEKEVRRRITAFFDRRIMINDLGLRTPLETDEAEYAYQIKHRRKLYRRMDLFLWWIGIRYLPRECGVHQSANQAPTLSATPTGTLVEPDATIWKSMFTESALLVRHDDQLNWNKFHYMLVIFGALMSGWVWSFDSGEWVPPAALAMFGMVLAIGADLTFQEGLRCLRAHRRKLAALEKKAPPYNNTFLLSDNAYNQRDVLELGPTVMFLLSVVLLSIALTRGFTPTAPNKSENKAQAQHSLPLDSASSTDNSPQLPPATNYVPPAPAETKK